MTRIWKAAQLSRNVFELRIPAERKSSWEFWCLLSSDRHWDNPKSRLDLQSKHLKEAVDKDAPVIDCGDLYDVMGGKYDHRSSKAGVRVEHQVDNYLDSIINTSVDWFKPYAKQFAVLGTGNHETAIAKRHETNLIERLIAGLNSNGGNVYNGGFSGWVVFKFERSGFGDRKPAQHINLHYDHGYGGGGPVTGDIIQHQRRSVYLPDADIVISGHTHDSWSREISRVRLSKTGKITHDTQFHLKLPTYKDDYGDGFQGWHAETGKPPKPLGAYWLKFFWDHGAKKVVFDIVKAR